MDVQAAAVEVVRLRHLVELKGAQAKPVRFVTLQGFVFRHAARTFMDTREPLLRSDWTIYRGGAIVFRGAEDEGNPGLERIEGTVYVDADLDEAGLRRAFDETVRRSPVAQTILRGTPLSLEVKAT